MKLQLHKYIFKMMVGLFIVSPSFVYAEGFKISLYPSKAEQVVSCVSFFAHKISVSDLTEFEYRKLLALANYELNMKTLPPLPNRIGESQMDVDKKLKEGMLEIVQLGISYRVYQEVLNYVKTSEDQPRSTDILQISHEMRFQKNQAELQALKQQAREVLLKYPKIIIDPNNLNLTNKYEATYLHLAAEENIIELVEALLLLEPHLINLQDSDGRTALMSAAGKGLNDVVRTLLDHDADLNLQNKDGWTAFMEAVDRGHNNVVRTLLENGVDPNLQDSSGGTALMYPAADGHNDVVTTLLEKGADPNLQDKGGMTALMWAVAYHRTDVIRTLIKNGADPTIKNNDNKTALNIAIEKKKYLTAAMLAHYQYKYHRGNKRKNMNRTN